MSRPRPSARRASSQLPRATAQRRRAARVRFVRVFVISSFYLAVLGANLFVGAAVVRGNFATQSPAGDAAGKNQTAHIRVPLADGSSCREMVIDNKTALSIEDKIARCPQERRTRWVRPFTWGGAK